MGFKPIAIEKLFTPDLRLQTPHFPVTILATKNAAAAAKAPITTTFNAPDTGGWPVTLLLK